MGTSVYYNPTTHELTCLVHSKNEIFFNNLFLSLHHCLDNSSHSSSSIHHPYPTYLSQPHHVPITISTPAPNAPEAEPLRKEAEPRCPRTVLVYL